jgi:hypothetical protein
MNRFKAAAIHFAISVVVASLVLSLMIFVWYPPPLFEVLGGFGLVSILAGVDVALGPLLTLVVYKQNKPSLKFDLAVIAALQLGALLYGVYVVSIAKPAYIVWVRDRFELVTAVDISDKVEYASQKSRFKHPGWLGPEYIGVSFPANAQERSELMFSAVQGGADIHQLPKYYDELESSLPEIIKVSRPISELGALNPTAKTKVSEVITIFSRQQQDVGFVPLMAKKTELTVFIDRVSGRPLKIVQLRPW